MMAFTTPELDALLAAMRQAALAAGTEASLHFHPGAKTTARVSYKTGGSPVTEADLAADKTIRGVLTAALPEAAIFSEEVPLEDGRFAGVPVFVIDPIDGTRAFMQGHSEWCVSIALMQQGRPLAGVIYAPARDEMFAAATGTGALLNGRRLAKAAPQAGVAGRIGGPRPLLNRLNAQYPALVTTDPLRALAYRLACVASGSLAVAIASEGAHDWDIAAADVILAETGHILVDAAGARPVYNAVNPVHPALIAGPDGLARRLAPWLAPAVAVS